MDRGECISELRQRLGDQVNILLAGRHKIVIYNNQTGRKEIVDPREFLSRCRDSDLLASGSVAVEFYNKTMGTTLGSVEEMRQFIVDNPVEHARFVTFMEVGPSPKTVH